MDQEEEQDWFFIGVKWLVLCFHAIQTDLDIITVAFHHDFLIDKDFIQKHFLLLLIFFRWLLLIVIKLKVAFSLNLGEFQLDKLFLRQ